MTDSTKMLQALIDGQNSIKEELLNKTDVVDKKVDRGFKSLKEEAIRNGKRIDNIGLELAELSDDAPTIKEHESLEKRVDKLEKQTASV